MVERKPVPKKLAARLLAARGTVEAARQERDDAIVAALYAGASSREIAKYIGLTPEAIRQIGKQHGWPDPVIIEKQRQAREAKDREASRKFFAEYGHILDDDAR